MKSLPSTWFLPLAVTFTLHTATPVILEKPDTLTVHSTGINNAVVIDSLQLNESSYAVMGTAVKGEITQTGENNSVEIITNEETSDSKMSPAKSRKEEKQITKNKTKKQDDSCPIPGGKEVASPGQHIKISQTGKNNSVKINSR